jgi:hypothetical protein
MFLTYRGQVYQRTSSVVKTEPNTVQMTYRGQKLEYTSHDLVRSPIYQAHQERLNLVYRGCAYSTHNFSAFPQSCAYPRHITKLTEQLGI